MEEKRFETEEFFKISLVEEVMKEFLWPAPYKVIDDGLDLFAEVIFPECKFLISDDGIGGTELEFTSYKGEDIRFSLAVALWVRNLETTDLNLTKRLSVCPNEEDTRRTIINTMIILQAYFLPFLTGNDDKLIEEAKNFINL